MPPSAPIPGFLRRRFINRTVYRLPDAGGVPQLRAGFEYHRHGSAGNRTRIEYRMIGLQLFLAGRGVIGLENGGTHAVSAGQVLVRQPGMVYSQTFDDAELACAFLTLPGEFAPILQATHPIRPAAPVMEASIADGWVRGFEEQIDQLEREEETCLAQAAARMLSFISSYLTAIARLDSEKRWFHTACRLLGGEADWWMPLPEIARMAGIGYVRFRTAFAAQSGMAPGEYRIRRRIEAAARMLLQHDATPSDVAFRLGYRDIYTFSKQFRAVMGRSPRQWRAYEMQAHPM